MVDLLHKEKMEVILLTGDKKDNALALQNELKLDRVYSELTPEDKTIILEKEMSDNNQNVAFLGDGINDAPSIMRREIGFFIYVLIHQEKKSQCFFLWRDISIIIKIN